VNINIVMLYLTTVISAVGSVIHLAAIPMGAPWLRTFRAPRCVVQSAEQGTLLAPVSALVIAALMALCASYALSALTLFPKLPFLRPALLAIGLLGCLRGIAVVPLFALNWSAVTTFDIIATSIWFVAGVGFLCGYLHTSVCLCPLD
jgi:hypothetical protein